MKSLMLLWIWVADELATRCCTSTNFDRKTVEARVKHEGLSFLTITLPQFGKDFEKSLSTGRLDKQDFQGFSWKSGLPKFLSGFLCQVFDASSGCLVDEPNIDAIHAIRQLTLIDGKLFQLTSSKRERAAMQGYIDCEYEVGRHTVELLSNHSERNAFVRLADVVFGRMFRSLEEKISSSDGFIDQFFLADDESESSVSTLDFLTPAHGPGATADGLKGNQKWRHNSWTVRLQRIFRMEDNLIPNQSFMDLLDDVRLIEPGSEIPVRVVSVPKTQKTPRIIAIEPTVMMFMQKALQIAIYDLVERDNLLKTLIGFRDQTPNQRLAMEGSRTGKLATLDLSEASDRVSCLHVLDLFHGYPLIQEAVMAVRSTKANVDGVGVIPLSKYASMGSALTFPIEGMVFLILCLRGIERELKHPLTHKEIKRFMGKVRVFGDDIIIPTDYAESVIETLECFGMKVNRTKSFWTGKFRESCGKEYYDGVDVSIVRVRKKFPTSRMDAPAIESWVKMSNHFFRSGLWRTTSQLDSVMSGILKDYPVVAETSQVLGRYSFCGYQTDRTGGRYQRPLVKGSVTHGVIPRNTLDEHYALHKWFSLRGDLPVADEKHLERSGRPLVSRIKRGWYSPF